MHRNSKLIEIPSRIALSTQVAATIRKAIMKGIWKKYVPSERQLYELLQVSRPTIRVALHVLEKEGLFRIRPRQRKLLIASKTHAVAPEKKMVSIITHEELNAKGLSYFSSIIELTALLADHGFGVETVVCKLVDGRFHPETLERSLRNNRTLCCLLLSVNKEVQRWFASQSIPALVLGSCFDQVRLPSIDIDLRSLCRHAAGTLLRHGHRRLAFILPHGVVAGDLASEQGFREAVDLYAGRDNGARAFVVRHDGTPQNIAAKLDLLFSSAEAPTALLVAKPAPVFAVLIHLLKHGISIPDTVSLISRDQDYFFETVNPTITHYQINSSSYARRAAHLVLKIIRQGRLPPKASLVSPIFFKGGTIGPPPAAFPGSDRVTAG